MLSCLGTPPHYRMTRNTPRADDSTSVPPASVSVLSPLNKVMYASPNAIVAQAARVHASTGPAVRVCPDSANAPLQMLQSNRVDKRPSSKVTV